MTGKISSDRFCINRKIAPLLSIREFFALVEKLSLNRVELRNDMRSGSVTDTLSGEEVCQLARQHHLTIETINALYPFNQLNEAMLAQATNLLTHARETGANALILCPLNDGTPVSDQQTVEALQRLAPLFAGYGIQALVEPLGFPGSSLRSASKAQQLINQAGVPFKIVLDTFHYYLCEDSEPAVIDSIDIQQIGLVHLSGVTDPRPTQQLTDEQRIMLNAADRLKSREQVARLEALGYRGSYAFEPFSSVMESWSCAEIEQQIRSSIDYLNSQ